MAILIDNESKEFFFKAGKIAAKALNYGERLLKENALLNEVLEKTENKILDLAGEEGGLAFPAQASINEVAAHFCPDQEVYLKSEDIIKLDVGAQFQGFIGDNAKTKYLGNNPEIKKLLEASKKALMNAHKILKPGIKLKQIGETIEQTIKSHGFNPIRNLSGHGLGVYQQHDHPSIPNYNNNDEEELEENEMIAIEPFATTGIGYVEEHGTATIYSIISNKKPRNPFARDILKVADKFEGLPFSFNQLNKELKSINKIRIGLNELKKLNIIHEYPPLVERTKGMVSQFEYSFLIGNKTNITTLDDD